MTNPTRHRPDRFRSDMRILFDRLNAVADQITLTIALENISAEMAEIDAIPIAMPRQHQRWRSLDRKRKRLAQRLEAINRALGSRPPDSLTLVDRGNRHALR